ncbi:hypothetical protein Y032_0016g3113 [Ancylostoma ceylanicum]|uniref:Uncharacterized protein n=1 Tax=Ancylostoma ceylanicum TaxID=53326 RepID=A0A016V615_9BILA|nr:hypothetical protein Y032_0016g3113 [Ancylostoma ceylanicum]
MSQNCAGYFKVAILQARSTNRTLLYIIDNSSFLSRPTTEELENPSSTACKNDDDCALVPDSYCRNFLCVAHKLQVPWNA